MNGKWNKDPSAVLDYEINWSKWLASDDTLSAHTITADQGITVDSSVLATDKVTVWLSGGTTGVTYRVACRVTTANGRTDERTIVISVKDR